MKEAIERVIAELEQETLQATMRAEFQSNPNLKAMYTGKMLAYSDAVSMLRTVIHDGENDSSGISGTDGQAQEQIPGKENGY